MVLRKAASTRKLARLRRLVRAKAGQVKDRGLWAVAAEAWARLGARHSVARLAPQEYDDFDQTYGTDTNGLIQPWDLDIDESLMGQAIQYRTANSRRFNDLLASLHIDHGRYCFIDLGSGKGRALLLASRYPFQRIVGVELSPTLHQVAVANIDRFRADWQRCRRIESYCGNAANFDWPHLNIVVYLFNPFGAATLKIAMGRLRASVAAAPRRVCVLYVKPVHRAELEQSAEFRLIDMIDQSAIYSNNRAEC